VPQCRQTQSRSETACGRLVCANIQKTSPTSRKSRTPNWFSQTCANSLETSGCRRDIALAIDVAQPLHKQAFRQGATSVVRKCARPKRKKRRQIRTIAAAHCPNTSVYKSREALMTNLMSSQMLKLQRGQQLSRKTRLPPERLAPLTGSVCATAGHVFVRMDLKQG